MSERPISAAIVDDERPARRLLRKMIERERDLEIIADCANVTSAIAQINKSRPDLIFLDIRMPNRDGFELLRALDSAYQPIVIFVTAYDEYAVKAFEYHALDYILKPIDPARFQDSLRRVRAMSSALRAQQRKSLRRLLREWEIVNTNSLAGNQMQVECEGQYIRRLFVKHRQKLMPIDIERIESIESDGHFVRIFADDRNYLIYGTLTGLEERLDPRCFARIHRKAIVRIKSIRQIVQADSRTFMVHLASGRELRISRSRRDLIGRLLTTRDSGKG